MFDINLLTTISKKLIRVRQYGNNISFQTSPIKCYDHFCANGFEYLILPVYNQHLNEEVLLKDNFKVCTRMWSNSSHSFAYRPTTEKNTHKSKMFDLTLMTLFLKESYQELDDFYTYYRTQGVEFFYMYYNGILEKKIKNLPVYEDVQYIEWNHPYLLIDEEVQKEAKLPANCHFFHLAQVPLLQAHMKKIGVYSRHTISCDVDEYIKASNHTIKEYLKPICENVFALNNYCFKDRINNNIYFEKYGKERDKDRGKTIYYTYSKSPTYSYCIHRAQENDSDEREHRRYTTHNIISFHSRATIHPHRMPFMVEEHSYFL